MTVYTFWNNKGGTGKTSLAFQTVCEYARRHIGQKILVIDLCPQANLSDLLLGGLLGNGGRNLDNLHKGNPRKSVAGYFQDRISSPYAVPVIDPNLYISVPSKFNRAIPKNIELLAGDQLVEIQTNAIATLSNTNLPGINTWLAVIDWINDFIKATVETYSDVFIDTNPSFSSYTQIALASTEKIILPIMADDSSKRAIQNVFSLIHGIMMPPIYQTSGFAQKLTNVGRSLPKIHLVVKNRLTQYMGPASAYQSIFTAIDKDVQNLLNSHPQVFSFSNYKTNGVVEVRDFQTTGVVAFAKGLPFWQTSTGKHNIFGKEPQVNQDFLNSCIDAIDDIVDRL